MGIALAATLLLAVLIGVSPGLLRGGGSILTVPILTYIAGTILMIVVAFMMVATSLAMIRGRKKPDASGPTGPILGIVAGVAAVSAAICWFATPPVPTAQVLGYGTGNTVGCGTRSGADITTDCKRRDALSTRARVWKDEGSAQRGDTCPANRR